MWLFKLVIIISYPALAVCLADLFFTNLLALITNSIELHEFYNLKPRSFAPPHPLLRHLQTENLWMRRMIEKDEAIDNLAKEMRMFMERYSQPSGYSVITTRLNLIRHKWIELLKATEGNCDDKEYLYERFVFYVFNASNELNLWSILDELSSYFQVESFLFQPFLTSNAEKSNYDVEQSRQYKLQRLIDDYNKTQYEGHLILRIAHKLLKGDGWERKEKQLRTRWNNIAQDQAEVTKQLNSLSDSQFRPDPSKTQGRVRVRRINSQSSWCRSHFFTVSPQGDASSFDTYPSHSNLQLGCISGPNETALLSDVLDGELPCEGDFMGATHRHVSTQALMVTDPNTQFICRLSFFENFCTYYPTLRIQADVCDKRNTTALHKVDTIYSSSSISNILKVTWPFIIEQNHASPTQLGYVVGVQLIPVNRRLQIGFHTSFREPINPTMQKPEKYKC